MVGYRRGPVPKTGKPGAYTHYRSFKYRHFADQHCLSKQLDKELRREGYYSLRVHRPDGNRDFYQTRVASRCWKDATKKRRQYE